MLRSGYLALWVEKKLLEKPEITRQSYSDFFNDFERGRGVSEPLNQAQEISPNGLVKNIIYSIKQLKSRSHPIMSDFGFFIPTRLRFDRIESGWAAWEDRQRDILPVRVPIP